MIHVVLTWLRRLIVDPVLFYFQHTPKSIIINDAYIICFDIIFFVYFVLKFKKYFVHRIPLIHRVAPIRYLTLKACILGVILLILNILYFTLGR